MYIIILHKLRLDQITCSGRSGTRCQHGEPKWYKIVKRLGTPAVGKPWNSRLNSLDQCSDIISDLLFSARTSTNSVLIPLRSDFRSEIVLWACSKLDSTNSKRSLRVDSIAERRSESLLSIYCRRLNTSDNCQGSCPSGTWPVLFFLKVTPLLMSILIWIAVLYKTNESITNFANAQMKSWTWQLTESYPKNKYLTQRSPVGQCRYTNSWLKARLSWLKHHVWSAWRSVTEWILYKTAVHIKMNISSGVTLRKYKTGPWGTWLN